MTRVNLTEAEANATACTREHADDPDDGIDGCPNCRLARDVLALVEEVKALRAVAEASASLIASLPKCSAADDRWVASGRVGIPRLCQEPATRAVRRGEYRWCDLHGADVPEYPRAAPLRALVAALRALDAGKETT